VESSDGGAPALECDRVLVRPKLFALLAGKLAIDEIDLDAPRARVVFKDGKLANLALKESGEKGEGPIHAPFNTFSVSDASIDFHYGAPHAAARSLDLDVTAEDDPKLGSSFEIALRAGRAAVQRPDTRSDGRTALDEDALCSVEGRVR